MGFNKKDKRFWFAVLFLIVLASFFLAFMFLPLIETDICTVEGECADTKILKSYYEILTGQ